MLRALFAAALLSLACSAPPTPDPGDAGNAPCAGACSPDEVCVAGQCLATTCAGMACAAGEACLQNVCVPRSCVGVACPAGELCAAGVCAPTSCGATLCGYYEVCQGGQCVQARCVGISCEAGSVCANGGCRPQSCAGQACASTQVCEGSACVDRGCVGITCAAGQRCAAGRCEPDSCDPSSCTSPPAATCVDASTLRIFSGAGGCVAGACSYPSNDTTCTFGCSAGACAGQPPSDGGQPSDGGTPLSFSQTAPQLRSRINDIDQAASAGASSALAVGPSGYVARWNGATWSSLPQVTTADLNAVWMVSPDLGYVVGDGGTLLRYSNGGLTALTSPVGAANIVAVHGNSSSHVFAATSDGRSLRFDGQSWTSGFIGPLTLSKRMVDVYVSPGGQERAVGQCGNIECAAYAQSINGTFTLANGASSGSFNAVGPSVTGGTDTASVATLLSGVRTMSGATFLTAAESGVDRVIAIAERTAGSTWLLTGTTNNLQPGRLYSNTQLTGTSAAPVYVFGNGAMSRRDIGGVLVVDSGPSSATILRYSSAGTQVLELGEDWVDATVRQNGALVLFGALGHVAYRSSTTGGYTLVSQPLRRTIRAGAAGASFAIAAGTGVHLHQLSSGWTTLSTAAGWNAACAAGDAEVHLVGANGQIAVYDANGFRTAVSPTTNTLNDVYCAGPGAAVAVGNNGTVLRLTNGAWSPMTSPSALVTATSVYVAPSGDIYAGASNFFARYSNGQWQLLQTLTGLEELSGAPDGTVLGTASNRIHRFTGTGWTPAFTASSVLQGAHGLGARLVFVGDNGTVVETP